ncbi:protein-tyrosine phosphatase family protein [Paenibacillus daejeonensis]|uniref:protein-tyrosine phosphatase family protein n=1 Tax=Paenibacillus daejeonensis TaxID=135193 RepID=UPI00037FBA4B|nr:dual specificity protein phosphatase family protein [Paenibacillus daejeonensis]
MKTYHALIEERIFMGGAADVKDMVLDEKCEVIVDLREEATECAYPETNATWIKVGIGDNAATPQEELFQEAINQVVTAYREGKKVAFHCGGGKGRTGAVSIGTLISLGKASSIEEAERIAKEIRPIIQIREPQREALKKLFESH